MKDIDRFDLDSLTWRTCPNCCRLIGPRNAAVDGGWCESCVMREPERDPVPILSPTGHRDPKDIAWQTAWVDYVGEGEILTDEELERREREKRLTDAAWAAGGDAA